MGSITETGIWKLDIAKKRHKCDDKLAKAIWTLYRPNSLADIGCGNGAYCKLFKEYGTPIVHGYEGTPEASSLGYYSQIDIVDLTNNLNLNLKYNTVICLEVGEHIPSQYEAIFLKNLVSFIGKNLIISWADKDQYSASGHVNPRSEEYVKELFTSKGAYFNEIDTRNLRRCAGFDWFKKNILIFEF
jgi:2-polyprenyl-3-methyl-5-hydroxy-6-metoxy-1,4-benzoquinol methylase